MWKDLACKQLTLILLYTLPFCGFIFYGFTTLLVNHYFCSVFSKYCGHSTLTNICPCNWKYQHTNSLERRKYFEHLHDRSFLSEDYSMHIQDVKHKDPIEENSEHHFVIPLRPPHDWETRHSMDKFLLSNWGVPETLLGTW